VDTGSAVTAVPAHFNRFVKGLQPTSKELKSVGDARLKVTGQVNTTISHGDVSIDETIYFNKLQFIMQHIKIFS